MRPPPPVSGDGLLLLLAISPEQLHWCVREELISLQGEQGLDASHAAGFTLHLALGQEEAVPHSNDDLITQLAPQRPD